MKRRTFTRSGVSFATVVGLAACGGSSGGSPARPVPSPSPSPSPTSTPSGPVTTASVTVSRTPVTSRTLDSTFAGLSYEKSEIYSPLFSSTNTSLLGLLSLLGPSVLRIGGNTVDETTWNPTGPGLTDKTVAPPDVDRLAGFLRAANWKIVYGLNLGANTPSAAASEAAYAANAFGSSLLGFEIGNEPDEYGGKYRTSPYTFAEFLADWQSYAAAIRAAVPGAPLTGPASASDVSTFTVPFAAAEGSTIELLTQHYYRANGQSPTSTLAELLLPDPSLAPELQTLVEAAASNGVSGGFRMGECNSYYNGGAPNVSDAYGTALWAIDFLFANALAGAAGINFHGGGDGPGYTPIADDGHGNVVEARPEFYGMVLFARAATGSPLPTTVDASGLNFTGYAVAPVAGGTNVVLVNKDATQTISATVVLAMPATRAVALALVGSSLSSPTGTLLGNAAIAPNGACSPTTTTFLVSGNSFTVAVPPASALFVAAT